MRRLLSKKLRQQVFESSIEFSQNEKGYYDPRWNFFFPSFNFYHIPCFVCKETINPFCFLIAKREPITKVPPKSFSTLFKNALELQHTEEGYVLICKKKSCSKKVTPNETKDDGQERMVTMKKMSNMAYKSIWTQYSKVNLLYFALYSCAGPSFDQNFTLSSFSSLLRRAKCHLVLLWFFIFCLSYLSSIFEFDNLGWVWMFIAFLVTFFEVELVIVAFYVSRFYVRCVFCASFVHPFHFVVGHNDPWSGRIVSRVEERKQKKQIINSNQTETSPLPEAESENDGEEEASSPSVNDPSNLWVLCDLCNLSQSKKTFTEFLKSPSLFPFADRKLFVWRYTTLFIHREHYKSYFWATWKLVLYSLRIGKIVPLTFLEFYAQKTSENEADFLCWLEALESHKKLNDGKTKRVVVTFDEICACIQKERKTNLFLT